MWQTAGAGALGSLAPAPLWHAHLHPRPGQEAPRPQRPAAISSASAQCRRGGRGVPPLTQAFGVIATASSAGSTAGVQRRRLARVPRRASCYDVLGVAPTASEGDIKAAFRRLARQYHPDVYEGPHAKELFQGIVSAYEGALEALHAPPAQPTFDAREIWRRHRARPRPPPQQPSWHGGHLGIADVKALKRPGRSWDCKWSGGVAIGGKIYAAPWCQEQLLVYDPRNGSLDAVDTSAISSTGWNWEGAVAVGHTAYFMPCNAENMLVYDTITGEVSGVDVGHVTPEERHKWGGAAVLDGKVYGVPYDSDHLLVYDSATGEAWGVDCSSVATGKNKWRGAVAAGGKIYCAPYCAEQILVYDTLTRGVSGIDITGVCTHVERMWSGGVVLDGKIYFAPFDADQLLIYDTETEELSGVATSSVSMGGGKWFGAVTLSEKVCFVPAFAKKMLVYDPVRGTLDSADVSAYPARCKWFGGVVVDGRGYGIPFDADHLLVFSCERL